MIRRWWWVLVGGVALVVCGWGVWFVPLTKWDEGIYSSVSLEMFQHHAWLTPLYHGQLFSDKPPLTFWFMNAMFAVLGPTELAVRFWSVVAGVLTTLLIAHWTRQGTKSIWAAIGAAAVFLTGRFIFFHSFRTGDTDGLLVLFWTAMLYAYWRSWRNQRWWWGVGLGLGLLLMTKPLIGLVPAFIIVLDLTFGRGWRQVSWRAVGQVLAITAVIAVPWHLFMWVTQGAVFWRGYIGFNVVQRATEAIYSSSMGPWWYWTVLKVRFFPWISFLPLALIVGAVTGRRPGASVPRLLTLWIIVTFAFFSFVSTKFDWYILPLYPAAAMLVTLTLCRLRHTTSRWLVIGLLLSIIHALYILPHVVSQSGFEWAMTPFRYLGRYWIETDHARLLVLMIGALGGGLLAWQWKKQMRVVTLVAIIYFGLLAVAGTISSLTTLDRTSPQRELAEEIEQLGTQPMDVVGMDLVSHPNLYFYLRRLPGMALTEGLTQPSGTRLVLTKNDAANTPLIQAGTVVMQRAEYIVLRPAGMKP